ncbi:MAG: DUF1653 domain-containing protein [Clostridia bacterium]|nr:DUF1653 domain-containing protein [Clostridia bacterium]
MSLYFKVVTDKDPLSYTVGEPIKFDISLRSNNEKVDATGFKYTVRQDDGKEFSGEGRCLTHETFTVETSLSRPGFVYLQIIALKPDGTVESLVDQCDSGAGADVHKLKLSFSKPEDFEKYWADIRSLIDGFTPELLEKKPFKQNVPDWCDCYDIKVSTPIDTVASGYLSIPKGEGPFPLEISFRGYAVVGAMPMFSQDKICVNFNAHGFENGFTNEALMAKYPELNAYGFNKEENRSPFTTYWRNMMIRNLAGGKWAKTIKEWDGRTFISKGGSQGAFQATIYASNDTDVTFLDIDVPWFCDLHKEESGYMKGWRPEPSVATDYFDTVLHAKKVKCPINIRGFLGDYVCPPSTLMTLYNEITAPKKITFIQSGTHGYRPHEIMATVLFDNGTVERATYRHYKGGIYQVLDIGKNSETGEAAVIYKSAETGEIWIRPLSMWNDTVFYNGEQTKRFTKI